MILSREHVRADQSWCSDPKSAINATDDSLCLDSLCLFIVLKPARAIAAGGAFSGPGIATMRSPDLKGGRLRPLPQTG